MYYKFYSFTEKPFNMTPDPRFIFLSKNHKEAFAHLLYGINNRAGFMVLTGEVGTGKTTVLRTLLDQLDPGRHRTALVFNPCLSPSQLLKNICREFGIPAREMENTDMLDCLNRFLLQQNIEGRTVVLVIDEAQNLDGSVLEQVRLISNLETQSCKLIQIILAGQPELLELLNKTELRQLNQRITVRYHLKPMDCRDSVEYVKHRLDKAGGRVIFSEKAIRKVFRYSGGIPRIINAVCDRILLAGYIANSLEITPRVASTGIRDFQNESRLYWPSYRAMWISVLAIIITVSIYYVYPLRLETNSESGSTISGQDNRAESNVQDMRSKMFSAELGRMSQSESAGNAFNALAKMWNVQPLSVYEEIERPGALKRAVQTRGLRLYQFLGDTASLLRFEYPALLEFHVPDKNQKRYAALVGLEKGEFLIDTGNGHAVPVPGEVLNRYWTGRGHIFWRNYWNLPSGMISGEKGRQVQRLQELLREAGTYTLPVSGKFDTGTRSAVRAFQLENGIDQDGVIGSLSLLLLYRSVDNFNVPKLTLASKK